MFIKFIILWVFDANCVPRRKTINYEFAVGSQPRLSSNVSHIFLNIIKFLYYLTPLRCDSVAVFFVAHLLQCMDSPIELRKDLEINF